MDWPQPVNNEIAGPSFSSAFDLSLLQNSNSLITVRFRHQPDVIQSFKILVKQTGSITLVMRSLYSGFPYFIIPIDY